MQKKNKFENNLMLCTAPALMQTLDLPEIVFPSDLKLALTNIYLGQSSSHRSNLCNNYIRCIESLSNVQKITELNYLNILKICLYLVQFELDLEMKKCTLLNYAFNECNSENIFTINMASLNIDPSELIRPGDIATLRETTRTNKTIWAKVVETLKYNVTIKLCCLKNAKILRNKEKRFNINFQSKHWPLRCCHYALMIISECNWREILYPQLKTNCIDTEFDMEWINTNIKKNERQKQAVMKILNNTARPAPYIIFGPPGTGKTATLVEVICQIVRQYPTKNILVCTVSNAAADEITKRLIKNKIPINLIYRMYAPSREWSSVDKEIRPCANFVNNITIFLSKEVLLLKKIIITTLLSSIRLVGGNFRKNHFSYVIIDEASQAAEPDMLIPLAVINEAEDERIGFQAQIVIAGDPYQLGPVVHCRRIEHLLGRSMLERLMNDCDLYKMQDGKYNPNYITKLIKNYRSHESLLYVSNKQFYNELEFCGGANTQMALNWLQLPNKKFPMIFQEVLGTEQRFESRSVYNTAEVLAVLVYVDILMNTKFGKRKITSEDIGIITPFTQQQLKIKHYLAAMNLKDITVGTVETFQGQERNVIILSAVRSKIFKHNSKEHIGFLSNSKRFNVALTRAKALMIIIGNPNILCTNEHWKLLWDYCKEHNGYVSFKQLPLKKNSEIVKLMGNLQAYSDNGSNTSNATNLSEKGERKKEVLFNVLVRKMESLTLTIKNND